ncbi:hypothetical protein [Vibrio phage RYC]|nr:hypothetical protein [Vibrio phage RYC]
MRCTDTDSKGKAIFQTSTGAYIGLTDLEMLEALRVIDQTLAHRMANKPREYIDSRQKRNY